MAGSDRHWWLCWSSVMWTEEVPSLPGVLQQLQRDGQCGRQTSEGAPGWPATGPRAGRGRHAARRWQPGCRVSHSVQKRRWGVLGITWGEVAIAARATPGPCPSLPCCGPAYGQTLAAVTRIRHVQGSPPHAARRCPMRESDRRALVAPHPHHLHRPILDLLDPPPLAWLWASGRGRAVPSGGRGSFSCRAPAGRPTAPRVFQLGPRNSRRRCRSQCSCFSHFANEKNAAWNGVHISRSTVLLAGARAGCFLHQCWARSLRRGPTWAEPSSPGSCPCPLPLGTGVRWLGPRASSGLQPGP